MAFVCKILLIAIISLMATQAKDLVAIDLNPIELFMATYLPHYLICNVPSFHREIYGKLDTEAERLAFEAPRDFAKSTVLSLGYPLYLICESYIPELQLFSRSGGPKGLSTKWMRKIKKELETNRLLITDYGIGKGSTWGQEIIVVKRADGHEIEVTCRGKGSAARGGRGWVIIDDPQDISDVSSEVILEADEDWFYSDIINILEPGQRCIFIGTKLSPLSLLSKVSRTPGWEYHFYDCYDSNGNSIWPEKWSNEELEKRKNEIGIDRFNAEYRGRPMISGNPVFKEEWLRPYEQDSAAFKAIEKHGLFTVTAIDPAISKRESADNTGIVTISATQEGKPEYYIRDVQRGKWSMKHQTERLFGVFDRFQQHRTIVETTAYQQALMEEIEERQRIYNIYINPFEIKPDRDKLRRAFAVQSVFQEGRVHVDFTNKGHQQLVDELLLFTGDGTYLDDCVDACVYALADLKNWSGQKKESYNFEVTPYGN